jgi:hypothetical protein
MLDESLPIAESFAAASETSGSRSNADILSTPRPVSGLVISDFLERRTARIGRAGIQEQHTPDVDV